MPRFQTLAHWLELLNQSTTALTATRAAEPHAQIAGTIRRFLDSQPPATRYRIYSMQELTVATGVPARFLGPVLIEFGWERTRRWSGERSARQANYFRYWVPLVPR